MEMLSNGYGCIKKRSKTLKQSLFDWILHKFNSLLIRTMSDVPTSSTSRASTSSASTSSASALSASTSSASTSSASTSSASTSQNNPYVFRLVNHDLDCSTTDDSEVSSYEEADSSDDYEKALAHNIAVVSALTGSDDDIDSESWSSSSSNTDSCENKSNSDISDTEKSILREMIQETWTNKSTNSDLDVLNSTPIIVLVQQPCETEGQLTEMGMNLINVEEHTKRLKELEEEMDYIELTEWMFRPIDSYIR